MFPDFFTPVCMLDKRTSADGYGGVNVSYVEGAQFMAGIVTKQSTTAQIAYQQGVKTLYTVVFEPKITLFNGDVIKRLSDGKVLRVTSNSRDMTTPEKAQLKMSQCTAEAIDL